MGDDLFKTPEGLSFGSSVVADKESESNTASQNTELRTESKNEVKTEETLKETDATKAKGETIKTEDTKTADAKAVETEAGEDEDDVGDIAPRHEQLDEAPGSHVDVTRADPTNTDLVSASAWEELNLKASLLEGVYAAKFAKPSKIQAVALPLILNTNEHMVAQAKNGAGKTATFTLAIISKINEDLPKVQTLCLSPTRELAKQNLDVLRSLGKFTKVKSSLACPPYRDFPAGTHVLSGTPGKIRDWIQRRTLDVSNIRMFVVDEADVMLDIEHGQGGQLLDISKAVYRYRPQILLFSATFPERVNRYVKAMAPKANTLVMRKENLTLDVVSQFYKVVRTQKDKLEALDDIYAAMNVGQCVMFVNTRSGAFDLAKTLKEKGNSVTLLTGGGGAGGNNGSPGLDHAEREQRMEEFRSGATRVLVTTDVLARGIDVPAVTLVINYDLPMSRAHSHTVDFETYLHRVGRTGRFGQKGIAISLVCGQDDLSLIRGIEEYYSSKIIELPDDIEEVETMMKAVELRT